MARLSRLAIAGHAHHLTQRSIERRPVFLDDEDRRAYLVDLRQSAVDTQVALHGYMLMDDHVHLVATPARREALGQLMQRVGRRYVARFNRRHGRCGPLWDGRFRAAVLDPERFVLQCLAHVELNPVRHEKVERAEQWPWSSAAHHLGLTCDPMLVDPPAYWRLGNTPFEREGAYRQWLDAVASDFAAAERLRAATRQGWAVGSDDFLQRIALLSPRPVAPTRGGGRFYTQPVPGARASEKSDV